MVLETQASAEFDVFAAHHARLFGDGVPSDFSLTLSEVSRLYGGPRVVLAPSFALTQADVRAKVVGAVTLAPGAALVLEGENVRVEGPLTLNGFLSVVNTRADATLVIKDLTVTNAGLAFADIPDAQLAQASPTERIRGYRTTVQEHLRVVIDEPGHFLLSGQGKLTKLNDAPDL